MSFLYPNTPLSFFPKGTTTSAGYTTRMLSVGTTTYSAQRVHQTYLSTVMMVVVNGQFLADYTATNQKSELAMTNPYQLYKVYVLTPSAPDGDLPYKPGDYFYPNTNLVGLVNGTSYPIRGVMPTSVYTELIIEKKW